LRKKSEFFPAAPENYEIVIGDEMQGLAINYFIRIVQNLPGLFLLLDHFSLKPR
jgi:hypothetical protein